MANLLLKIWVSFRNRWKDLGSLSLIVSCWSSSSWWSWSHLLLHTWLLWHGWLLSHWWSWCNWLTWHLSSWLLVLVLITSLVLSSIVVVRSSVSTTLVVVHSLVSTLSWVNLIVLLHKLEKLLDDLCQVWLTGQIVPLESTSLLLSILFPISLIFEFSHLHSSNLLDFIIVDNENLTFECLVLQSSLSSSTSIWLFEADKSIRVTCCTLFKSNIFNFSVSVVTENILKSLLSPVVWEVLDVKVDSLL